MSKSAAQLLYGPVLAKRLSHFYSNKGYKFVKKMIKIQYYVSVTF